MKQSMLWILAVIACTFLPANGQSVLDCSNAIEIFHGQTVQGTTVGASSKATKYHGCTWNESGNEVMYFFNLSQQGRIVATLTDISANLDIFILSACDTSDCRAFGDRKAVITNALPGKYIIVVDGRDNSIGTYTITIQADSGFPGNVNQIIWQDDFESNESDNRWYASQGIWEIGKPSTGPQSSYIGSRVAATVLNGNYENDRSSSLVGLDYILIPPASETCFLILTEWYNFSSCDSGYVRVNEQGSNTWEVLEASATKGNTFNDWRQHIISLSKYSGKSIRFSFYFTSKTCDYLGRDYASGWYIDRIAIVTWKNRLNYFSESWNFDIGSFTQQGWQAWEVGVPTSGPLASFSPPFCVATLLDKNYPNDIYSRLVSPKITIPSGSANTRMRFRHFFQFSDCDFGRVEIKTENSTKWLALETYTTSSSVWTYPYIDLTTFADSTIQVGFYFYSKTCEYLGRDVAAGWYIDDFLILFDNMNVPPEIIQFRANTSNGIKPLGITFICEAVDQDGRIENYRWDLDGNGTIDTTTTTGNLIYTYTQSGLFDATCTVVDNNGATATSAKLNITVQNLDRKNISFADTTISAGGTFAWPLYIDNAAQLAGVSAKIKYDPVLLKALKVSTTPLSSGFTLADTIRNGTIALGMARASGIAGGSGAWINLEFQVSPTAKVGDTCSVVIESCEVYNDQLNSIPVSTRNGKLTVAAPITGDDPISLSVSPAADTLAPGQTLQIIAAGKNSSGAAVAVSPSWRVVNLFGAIGSVAPASGGNTTFTATAGGDGLVIASQASLADTCILISCQLLGDLNIDQKITVVDAIIALQIAAGKRMPSRYEAYASDLNNSKSTDEGDAYLILVTSLDGMLHKSGAATLAEIRWQPLQQLENGLWRCAIQSESDATIHGAGLALKFDVSAMTPVNVTSPDANTMITTHTLERGQLNVSMINRTGLAALEGVLLYVDFKTNGEHKDGVVRLESLRCFNSNGQAMTVLVGEAPVEQVAKPQGWTLHPNYPNPFNPFTSVTLELPVSEHVQVVIFNTNGQKIRTLLDAAIPAGLRRLQWDGLDELGAMVPAGLYFCQMRCVESRHQQTIKMMLVK